MTQNPIATLETQLVDAAERHFNAGESASPAAAAQRRLRRVPASMLALITAAVVSVPALAATGVIDVHSGGPVTPRVEVASGSTPQTGRWRLLYSQDAAGKACVGLQLPDERQPGESPVLYEGCGGSGGLNTASLSGPTRSLVYGRAPTSTSVIELSARRGVAQRIRPKTADAAATSKFFLAVLPPGEREVMVAAKDEVGRTIAKQLLPTTDHPR